MLFSVIQLSINVSVWNIVLLCSGLAAEGNTNVMGEPPYGYPRPRHRFSNRCVAETQAIWSQEASNFEDNDKVHHRTHYLSTYCPVSLAFPRCVDSSCNKIQWPLVTMLNTKGTSESCYMTGLGINPSWLVGYISQFVEYLNNIFIMTIEIFIFYQLAPPPNFWL